MLLEAALEAIGRPWGKVALALIGIAVIFLFIFAHSVVLHTAKGDKLKNPGAFETYVKFCWNCFFKPHQGDDSRSQQEALESFYGAQASIYDATRAHLLQGREDMLGLVAAQLKSRTDTGALPGKPTWIDMGGGTGYNIETMSRFIDVPNFFKAVYVVDLSPSLCRVAEDRFKRLGWKNVVVVCKDARLFRLEDYEDLPESNGEIVESEAVLDSGLQRRSFADVVTMSYSLSMIPDYYSVVDSLTSILSKNGIFGVADFYVQSEIDYQCRNYTGGEIDRHCMWISRVFWRTWFEADRVSLEAARRDYLEYRFGTVLSFNARCKLLGLRIPYYVWIGCNKDIDSSRLKLEELNAAATESPFISALDLQSQAVEKAQRSSAIEIRSKAYESAIVNLGASLPLPPSWYQAHHWRIYFDEALQKHKQFKDEYIYAFTWEDSVIDTRLLKIQEDDVILAITSAGDNILSYALERPKRIHAVDLNPNQNHLLELKLAAFTALGYSDMWKLFGEGKHDKFRELLMSNLSPHLSSLAFQYWLQHGPKRFSSRQGLYYTGGSGVALKLIRWLFKIVNLHSEVQQLCKAQTLNEQREVWHRSVRRVLLSRLLSWTVISNKAWLWKALGVPPAQKDMIEQDYTKQAEPRLDVQPAASEPKASHGSRANRREDISNYGSGLAIWEYAVNTLDPVISNTLLSNSNHYYLLCLLGHYTQRCHPEYLSPKAHVKLSKPGACDRIRIHTDEVNEVVERMTPGTLTIAVLMDSMDWFNPETDDAAIQITKVRCALKTGGRVLVRSAGLNPWYIAKFEEMGFSTKRVAARVPGSCIDRVNMYASTWICTKVEHKSISPRPGRAYHRATTMEPLSIGEAMQS